MKDPLDDRLKRNGILKTSSKLLQKVEGIRGRQRGKRSLYHGEVLSENVALT